MVDHKVHHQLHTPLLQLGDQVIYIFNSAIFRIDCLVIGYIVSHVFLRTFIYYHN